MDLNKDNEKVLLINDKSNSSEQFTSDTDSHALPEVSTSGTSSEKTTGTLGAIFIVVNAAMGAGLLNIPDGFKLAGGVGPGIAVEMCFLLFILGSLMILGYCAHVYESCTYQEVIETLCGKIVGVICECCIILYMYGTSIAMIIIVGDQFDKVMEAIVGPYFCHRWYCNRQFTMSIFSILVIFPLCIPKHIGFLRHARFLLAKTKVLLSFSIVGVLATIIVMFTVVIKFATSTYVPGPIRNSPRNASELLSAIPTIFFAYQCHVSSVPVYAALRHKTAKNWIIVILSAVFLCAISYTLTGICGYLTFGDDVKSDILQSYNAEDVGVIVARVAIVIAMLTSYPIVHFCGRAALFTLFIKVSFFTSNPNRQKERLRRCITTAVWFSTSLVLALFIPNIGEAIAVVGGLAGCFILLFPGLCLLWLAYDMNLRKRIKYFLIGIGMLYTILGTFLFGEITTEAIMNDIYNADTELSSQCYAS